MVGTARKIMVNIWMVFSYGLLHMDTPVLADQQELTYINCVDTGYSQED